MAKNSQTGISKCRHTKAEEMFIVTRDQSSGHQDLSKRHVVSIWLTESIKFTGGQTCWYLACEGSHLENNVIPQQLYPDYIARNFLFHFPLGINLLYSHKTFWNVNLYLVWCNLENVYPLGLRMSDFLWKIQNNGNDKPEHQKRCEVWLGENKFLLQGLIIMPLIIIIIMIFWSTVSFCPLGIVVKNVNTFGVILKAHLTTLLRGHQEKEDL